MKLDQNEKLSLFSNIELPDIFFTEYLSPANGNYVKVYLYMLFLSKYNKEIKLNDLSKKLALPFNVIQEAIKYWESQGVLTKKTTGYTLNSIQEIELYKLYKPKLSLSPEAVEKNTKNQYRAKAIESINNTCFQGMMPATWYLDIEMWFKKYSFDEQVMIALFEYCFNKSALHRNYVQAVAETWYKNNVKTFTDLDEFSLKQQKSQKLVKSISKKLGRATLTQYEEAYIEKWSIDFGYSLDIIELALKKTTSKSAPNFNYINSIIEKWHDRNLKTIEDIKNFEADLKQKNKNIKTLEKKTGYKNYTQRDYQDLDALYTDATQAQ